MQAGDYGCSDNDNGHRGPGAETSAKALRKDIGVGAVSQRSEVSLEDDDMCDTPTITSSP